MRQVVPLRIVLILALMTVLSGAAAAGGRALGPVQDRCASEIQPLSADGVPTIWPTSVNLCH